MGGAGGGQGLRGIAGATSSRVGVVAAMRARDVSRPAPDDLQDPPEDRRRRGRRREGTADQSTDGSAGSAPETS
jgi:hypothetical protein